SQYFIVRKYENINLRRKAIVSINTSVHMENSFIRKLGGSTAAMLPIVICCCIFNAILTNDFHISLTLTPRMFILRMRTIRRSEGNLKIPIQVADLRVISECITNEIP
ncbi:hypothetical protein L9F63_016986, partial [Diploptera punctata]